MSLFLTHWQSSLQPAIICDGSSNVDLVVFSIRLRPLVTMPDVSTCVDSECWATRGIEGHRGAGRDMDRGRRLPSSFRSQSPTNPAIQELGCYTTISAPWTPPIIHTSKNIHALVPLFERFAPRFQGRHPMRGSRGSSKSSSQIPSWLVLSWSLLPNCHNSEVFPPLHDIQTVISGSKFQGLPLLLTGTRVVFSVLVLRRNRILLIRSSSLFFDELRESLDPLKSGTSLKKHRRRWSLGCF
ncbi:uncharacterized protein B0T23DRAFT_2893 [Neurospora hispaniola]|uniref:Uncharacterized protein n=1 Tax=Neurospora hispaniola TaxID=588809 RepID=A0AAJ0MUN9_9PEZI|nr:hypothetical protein B0T23DRAFT_2893 [Neurospora hispaniola]